MMVPVSVGTLKFNTCAGISKLLKGISMDSVCQREGIPVASWAAAIDRISFTESVPAGAEIFFTGLKLPMLALIPSEVALTTTGTLNLSLKLSSSENGKELRKGILSQGCKDFTSHWPSHLAMAPENLLCILLSVGLGMAAASPMRKPFPALAAMPKLMPLFLVAIVWWICSLLMRAHGLPILLYSTTLPRVPVTNTSLILAMVVCFMFTKYLLYTCFFSASLPLRYLTQW